ncbi:MAG: hypothetical protein ACRD8W_11690 [Nitrososphaeraceae archaeon]
MKHNNYFAAETTNNEGLVFMLVIFVLLITVTIIFSQLSLVFPIPVVAKTFDYSIIDHS